MSTLLVASSDTIRRVLPALAVVAVGLATLLVPADALFVGAMAALTGVAVRVGQLRRDADLG